jgi:hypothetical protein
MRGRGGIGPSFLSSALDGSGRLHAPAAVPPGIRRIGGWSRSRRCEEKNLAPARIRTTAVQPVAIMTRNFKIIFPKN